MLIRISNSSIHSSNVFYQLFVRQILSDQLSAIGASVRLKVKDDPLARLRGLGDILGGLTGGGAGQHAGMGGLGGLVEQMQRAGYGEQARSWVSTGQNMPIDPGAMEEIFGQGGMDEIARRAGITREQANEGMAELLPEVVDHITPGGEGTDFDQLTRSVDDLQRRMGG